MPSARTASSESEGAATQYGRYQLIRKLATGGMAEVYLARQTGMEGFEKLLVVKRILPHLAGDEEFVQMFLNEARIAARFNHPNIVQIYDLGQEEETFFIAMEFIHGEDLGRIMRKAWNAGRWIDTPLSLRVVALACEGLFYAHSKTDDTGRPLNVVHRDISPQNILVSFDGGVKVVDFGIARAADSATMTKSGTIKGKYAYMSPEQAQGKNPDARTDVFALGLVLYELLTGVRPLKRETDIQTLQAALSCEIEPPSQVAAVSDTLDPLVMRALTAKVGDRFQTAREFQLAIEEYLIQNQLAASSIHLSEFMRDLFADRLAEEAKQGRPVPSTSSSGSLPAMKSFTGEVPARSKSRGVSAQSTAPIEVPDEGVGARKRTPSRPTTGAAQKARSSSRVEQPIVGSDEDDDEPTSLEGDVPPRGRSGPSSRPPSMASAEPSGGKRRTGEIPASRSARKSSTGFSRSDSGSMPEAPSRTASATGIPRSDSWKVTNRPSPRAEARERSIGVPLFLVVVAVVVACAYGFKDQLLAMIKPVAVVTAPVGPASNLPNITFVTDPDAMNLYVDGQLVGQTPYTFSPTKPGKIRYRLVKDSSGLERQRDLVIASGDPSKTVREDFATGRIQLVFDRPNLEGDVYLGSADLGHVPGPQLILGEGQHDLVVKNPALGLNAKVRVTVQKSRTRTETIVTRHAAASDDSDGDDSSN